MPYCPQCRDEFQDWVETCPDCKVPLVNTLPPLPVVEIPDGTHVIDGSGKYLMPGLADMHIHTTDAWQSMEWPVSPIDLFLANGVTTIRD